MVVGIANMRLNKGALKLCAAYLAFAMLMLIWSHLTPNIKFSFMLGQIAILPAGAAFGTFHLFPLMYAYPWTNSFFLAVPVSALIVCLIGWAISAVVGIGKDKEAIVLARKLDEDKNRNS
jgi:hypothetical protein